MQIQFYLITAVMMLLCAVTSWMNMRPPKF